METAMARSIQWLQGFQMLSISNITELTIPNITELTILNITELTSNIGSEVVNDTSIEELHKSHGKSLRNNELQKLPEQHTLHESVDTIWTKHQQEPQN